MIHNKYMLKNLYMYVLNANKPPKMASETTM